MSNASWSDDRVSTLRKLWFKGLSASQIARRLGGVTRNAVIGKVHRLGLSGRSAPSAPSRTARVSPPRARRSARPVPPPRPAAPPRVCIAIVSAAPQQPGLVRDVTSLTAHTCRWPIGDPKAADFSYCGERTSGRRYCEVHTSLGTRPGAAWQVDRDPVVRRALAGLI